MVFSLLIRTFAAKMEKILYYMVAGHVFTVCNETNKDVSQWLDHYKPFAIDVACNEPVFTLHVKDRVEDNGFEKEIHQDDDGSEILAGHLTDGNPCFRFLLRHEHVATMVTNKEYRRAELCMMNCEQFGLDNALMVMYALATATLQTALFHSSVVSYQGCGYMFLGKSGTGKSTHSSLWLKHVGATELVNDDNPVVRRMSDGFYVFGSPWSGKTPCYRNVRCPLGGVVQLSQAPYNKIQRLSPLMAYAALVPSISGKRWDKQVAEGLHETEDMMAGEVDVWHLECLPDADAAQLCSKTIRKA